MISVLKKLVNATGISGREAQVRDLIKEEIAPYVDGVETDAMGNLIAHKKGNGKKLLFAAHTDSIGFFVTFIEKNGAIRVSPVGDIDFLAFSYSEVISENGVKGVIVSEKDGEIPKADSVYIDIGAKSEKQAKSKVSVGDFFVPAPRMTKLLSNEYAGHSFDGKVGCAILIEAIKQIKETKNDLYFVFTVQQEVYSRGARVAAYSVRPDVAVAVDTTDAKDKSSVSDGNVVLGEGVSIKIKTSRMIYSPEVVEKLREISTRHSIKYQCEIANSGTEGDAKALQNGAMGCLVGAISVPCANIHTSSEIIDIKDVQEALKLVLKIAEEYEI